MIAPAFCLTVLEHSGSFPGCLHGIQSFPVSSGDQGSQLSLLPKRHLLGLIVRQACLRRSNGLSRA